MQEAGQAASPAAPVQRKALAWAQLPHLQKCLDRQANLSTSVPFSSLVSTHSSSGETDRSRRSRSSSWHRRSMQTRRCISRSVCVPPCQQLRSLDEHVTSSRRKVSPRPQGAHPPVGDSAASRIASQRSNILRIWVSKVRLSKR